MTNAGPNIVDVWRDLAVQSLEGLSSHDANMSGIRMSHAYTQLSESERRLVQPLIDEWILSDLAGYRFDALTVVRKNRVKASLPALRQLAARLEKSDHTRDTYEWAKVNRIIGTLIEPRSSNE